jgi:hypothetical protein
MTDDLPAADQTAVKKSEIPKKKKKKKRKEKKKKKGAARCPTSRGTFLVAVGWLLS